MDDPVLHLLSGFDDWFSWFVVFLPLMTGMAATGGWMPQLAVGAAPAYPVPPGTWAASSPGCSSAGASEARTRTVTGSSSFTNATSCVSRLPTMMSEDGVPSRPQPR